MDNFRIEVTGHQRETFNLAIQVAFQKWESVSHYAIDPEKGLVLYYGRALTQKKRFHFLFSLNGKVRLIWHGHGYNPRNIQTSQIKTGITKRAGLSITKIGGMLVNSTMHSWRSSLNGPYSGNNPFLHGRK